MRPRLRVIVPVRPGDSTTSKLISLGFWLIVLVAAIVVLATFG